MNLAPSLSMLFAQSGSNAALITFTIYTLAVFGLAALSNRLLQSKSFLSEYFLGSRSLGVWAFALTFAATSASGGSFTGFPSKIYTHGWVLALWIGSYMVVPICTMGLMGKRINQVARISGSITVPDVIRDRFRSATFGLLAVSLIVFFMSFNLVAQFKAGSLILKTLLADVQVFKDSAAGLGSAISNAGLSGFLGTDGQYLLCLLGFGIAVVIYTTYGGFHAVVWTDVMQGVVMVIGVMILLPLALTQVGGLEKATKELAKQRPHTIRYASVVRADASEAETLVKGTWSTMPIDDEDALVRIEEELVFPAGETTIHGVRIFESGRRSGYDEFLSKTRNVRPGLTFENLTKENRRVGTVTVKLADPVDRTVKLPLDHDVTIPRGTSIMFDDPESDSGHYYATTRAGEFLREFTIPAGDVEITNVPFAEFSEKVLEAERQGSMPWISVDKPRNIRIKEFKLTPSTAAYGADQQGVYVTGPGPSSKAMDGFLPLSLAISFFFMWSISGSGQPSNMVRLMAFNNATTLRRSIFTVAMYYSMIYFPLVIIFCCARVLMPGMETESDRIMPAMAVYLTENAGMVWLAGLLVAAPFAAVMSTVDSFLLMISSALVRDIYQRNLNPNASEKTIKKLSYLSTMIVGTIAMIGAVNPPDFLQDIIVYVGSGLAACFLGPMVYALYWPRVNTPGAISGMLAGFAAHLSCYVAGIAVNGSFFRPARVFNFDPIIIGLLASFTTVYVVTRMTPPPPDDLVRKYFGKS